ncbi:hypothetical protein [Fibrella aquatilis]|uniref:Uncharacterized protein n=1 Tax=Fibrella aquatilis TaxID=2817059 RepID=A0A939G9V0_9BACT|nr:hypothetical protein [Fibrella aquatilis]MBO0932463.1 hypothetical protein [Fibrella aquatilis]
MIRYLFFALAGLCFVCTVHAQTTNKALGDAIYFANGDRFKDAQLESVTADKVKFTVKRGEVLTNYTYGRDNVIMAFTQEGNYLIIKDLSSDFDQAGQQLKDFLMAPARTAPTDLMVRRVPLEVLRGVISYESDDVINYQPTTGGAASISKTELLVILHRDGKHQILGDPNEIAPILTELRPQLLAPNVAPPEPAPAPVVAPASEPVTVAPAAPARQAKTAPSRPAPARPDPAATSTPPPGVASPAPAAAASGAKASLNESEYITYRAKAMQRVDEFVSYINIITDKTLTGDDKDRAIDQAVRLFMPGATVAVTSASKPNPPRTLDVRTYLTRLKLLPYTYTKVSWSEVQYVKELTQAPDGNYYGVITGQQTFTGYGKADAVSYSDVTQKNVRVKLQPYQKMIEGQAETNWQVLLGNVGVGSN